MHLQVASILAGVGAVERRIAEDSEHLGTAEEVGAKLPAFLNLGRPAAERDGLLDRRRGARVEDFEDDAGRGGADARDFRQRPARLQQRRERLLEREHRGGRPLVAEHLLL